MKFKFIDKKTMPKEWLPYYWYDSDSGIYLVEKDTLPQDIFIKGLNKSTEAKTQWMLYKNQVQLGQMPDAPEEVIIPPPAMFKWDTPKYSIKFEQGTKMYVIMPNPNNGFESNEQMGRNTLHANKESHIGQQVDALMKRGYSDIHVFKVINIYKAPKIQKPVKYNVTEQGEVLPA